MIEVLPLADRTIKTCKDAAELQNRIAMNMKAIRSTVPIIQEAIEDEDPDFALEELANLTSQAKGLYQMINEAKVNGCLLNDVDAPYETLCQVCLREVLLTNKEELNNADAVNPNGNSLCECGGDVCDCKDCINSLDQLKSGIRDKTLLGLQSDIIDWSPSEGVVHKYHPIIRLLKSRLPSRFIVMCKISHAMHRLKLLTGYYRLRKCHICGKRFCHNEDCLPF